jgi:hypothetical protein
MKKYILCLTVVFLCMTTSAHAQEIDGAFGIDLGYLVTMGDWNSLRINEEIKMFNSNFSYGAELEFRVWDLPMGIFFNYAKLSTSEYQDYVEEQGEYISASASMMNFGLLLKYYAVKSPKHFFNVDLGLGYIGFSGSENSELYSYDYDFISKDANFTIVIGLGYKFKLEENIALSLTAREIINPGGIKYADGKGYDVLVLPVCLGLRYLF